MRILLVIATLLGMASSSYAAILYEQDFNSWPANWNCSDGLPANTPGYWASPGYCRQSAGWAVGNCVNAPNADLMYMSAGNNGGNALTWSTCETLDNMYMGQINYKIAETHGQFSDLHFRWSTRVNPAFDKAIAQANSIKILDRIIVRTSTGPVDLYPHLFGSSISAGAWELEESTSTETQHNMYIPATWRDGNWHTYELRIKLNSTSVASDGILQVWFDGALVRDLQNIRIWNYGGTNPYFDMWFFGLGNSSGTGSYFTGDRTEPWQASWQILQHDDLAIGTSYIGVPPGTGDNPPTIAEGSPTGTLASGTTQTTMSVSTNENATCKYSATAGVAYASMTNTFSTTGGAAHSTTITGLQDGQNYSRYVRCIDGAGNANPSDYVVSWSVLSSGPPPSGVGKTLGTVKCKIQ